MPLFDYFCDECEFEIDDRFVRKYNARIKCPNCGKKMRKLPSTGVVADTFPSEGVYLEHVSPTGKTFRTKTEMKKYAKKHELDLGYLG